MKKSLLAFALIALGFTCPVKAQFGSFGDIPIDIDAENFGGTGDFFSASGNVQISYGATTIYCDNAQYDPNTRDVLVSGNVRIYRDGNLITSERAVYNLETKEVFAADVKGESNAFKFAGDSMITLAGNAFTVKEGIFTTSDSAQPDWSLRSRKTRIYPKDRLVMNDVKLYIGNTPVFWFPYVWQSLNKENFYRFTPGYSSVWGTFLLNNYTFPISETMSGSLHLDLRSERGVAIGFDTEWEDGLKKQNWGRFKSYILDDANPGINETAARREPIDSGRYRVSLQARQYLTEDIYASIDITKLSDSLVMQDFYEGEFRLNPQPDNVGSITKLGDDYAVTGIVRGQLNDFFDATERLPELALDITRQPFFFKKLFYQGETSGGYYRRHFAENPLFEDYSATRLDTFHQWLYPDTYFGWLSVVPRMGVRGTWYSDSGYLEKTTETETVTLADGSTATLSNTYDRLVNQGSVFRPVFNAGFEASFKASKVFEDVQTRTWGLDGLRHVVQPYMNLSFVEAGEEGQQLLQFDRLNRSTQLPAIDFPDFNMIDSIDNWNILRLGMRNRLQTRRDNATINWLEMNTFFDINFERPDFGPFNPDGGSFSNLVNRIRWAPLTWVNLTLDCQLPLLDEGFTEVNTRFNFFVNQNLQINIGHRYLGGNILFQDSSLLDFGAYLRINDNWSFSVREQYEFTDSTLESQRYELHRDLSSWIASLGLVSRTSRRGNEEVNDYGVLLTFTLKDLPGVKIPLSFDPSGEGSSGSGKNR